MKSKKFKSLTSLRLTTLFVLTCFIVNMVAGNVVYASELFRGDYTYKESNVLHYDGTISESEVVSSTNDADYNNISSISNNEDTKSNVKENNENEITIPVVEKQEEVTDLKENIVQEEIVQEEEKIVQEDETKEDKGDNFKDVTDSEQSTNEDLDDNISDEEDKHITKNLDIFDVAIVGLLDKGSEDVSYENILNVKNRIPEGSGIWIVPENRESVLKIINDTSQKQYYIDQNGFLKQGENTNEAGSKLYSKIIDKLIASSKVLIIGRSNGWNEYDAKQEKIVHRTFTDGNAGVTIGGKFTDQLVIISDSTDESKLGLVLAHELVHGLRGQEGYKDRIEEELYAVNIENQIRSELKQDLRDTSDLKDAYKDISNEYRDDYEEIAFGAGSLFFATVNLSDSSSALNFRTAPSTDAAIVGSIPHGVAVSIIARSGDWYKINFMGTFGYVNRQFLILGGSSGSTTGTVKLQDTSSYVNLRSGASTDTSIIGSLTHGTSVKILGIENSWYKVNYNGKVGYIRDQYVTSGSVSSSTGGTGTIKLSDPSSSVNVRSGSSTSHSIVGSLTHGTVVQILGSENGWYKIKSGSVTGYVKNDFIAKGGTGTIKLSDPSSSVNVRSGSSTSHSIVGSLTHGTVVQIIGNENGWCKIRFNGTTGYVKNDFVTAGGLNVSGGTGTIKLSDPSSSVNIRSGSSTSHSVIGSLYHGAIVQILGNENGWYKIKSNGVTGYVKQEFITSSSSGSVSGMGTIKLQDPSSSVNIRSGSSTSHSVIGSLYHANVVQVIGIENGWYKIKYGGLTGYVKEEFMVLGGSSSASSVGTIKLQDSSSSVNVRSGSSTSHSVLGSLRHGDVVQIIGEENGWYKISRNRLIGYVKKDFITLGANSYVGSDSSSYGASLKEVYIRYYAQDDPRYGNVEYTDDKNPSQTIANSGCGPTAFSIVVSTLNRIDVPPTEMCRYAVDKDCRTKNDGTEGKLFRIATSDPLNPRYHLNQKYVSGASSAKNLLSDGKHLVIVMMTAGHVTKGGHYIVLSGTTTINGKVYFKVYDPHRWNENYIYDGEIIDNVKDDGFILLSETVVRREGRDFYGFSNLNNTYINSPSSSGSVMKPSVDSGVIKPSTGVTNPSTGENITVPRPGENLPSSNVGFDPNVLCERITLDINGVLVNYKWEYNLTTRSYYLWPTADNDFDEIHHGNAIQLTPATLGSLIISFSPLDTSKDVVDFIYGKDFLTGEEINRGYSAVFFVLPGSGSILSSSQIKNLDDFKTVFKNIGCLGKLKYLPDGSWQSTAGLIYRRTGKEGNRVKHVLEHAVPNLNKDKHSVFNVARNKILEVVDEAWLKKDTVQSTLQSNGNRVFKIPMGKVIGTDGETVMKIVIKDGTMDIITAYPIK